MFKTFTLKSLASLALVAAVACVGAADPALAARKKIKSEGMPHETVRQIEARDHRNGGEAGGGFTVTSEPRNPIVRDHRAKPVVRDHRAKPVVRDHRAKPVVRDHRAKPVVRDHRAATVRKKKKIFGMPGWN